MEYERKPNTATLFREVEKNHELGPDYTGNGLIEGKELRLSGWINESKNGKKYLSLKFEEPRQAVKPASPAGDEDEPF